MNITIVAVGKKMPAWVQSGYEEYTRRLRSSLPVKLVELNQVKSGTPAVIKTQEGERLLQALPASNSHVVALDPTGQSWTTEQTAGHLERWKASGKTPYLLIGGPEGLSDEVLARSDQIWSLSALTFPHPLVRVILAEQLYRAESVLRNHPYHRA